MNTSAEESWDGGCGIWGRAVPIFLLLFPLLLVMHSTSFFFGNPHKFKFAFRSIVIYAFLLNCLNIHNTHCAQNLLSSIEHDIVTIADINRSRSDNSSFFLKDTHPTTSNEAEKRCESLRSLSSCSLITLIIVSIASTRRN